MTALARYRPVLVLAAGLAAAIAWGWSSAPRLDTLVFIATTGVIATSLALVYGQAGVLSVAQAAFASIGGYATAIATVKYDLPVLAGLALAVVLPAVFGYVLSRVVVRLSHLALAVATLLVSEVLAYALSAGGDFTGGFIGIAGIPSWGPMSDLKGAAIVGGILLLGATFTLARVAYSQQGRALRVIAADKILAASLGINVVSRLSWLMALSAGMAGLAGWFYAHTRNFMAPDALTIDLSLTVIFMVIIGGKATVLGPVVGTALLTLISDAVPSAAVRGMFYGGALIVVLLLFPQGLLGTNWKAVAARATARARGTDDRPTGHDGSRPGAVRGAAEAPAAIDGGPR